MCISDSVLSTALGTMHALAGAISIIHLQKLRLGEIKWLTQGHTASRWHRQDLNQHVTQKSLLKEPWMSKWTKAWGGKRVRDKVPTVLNSPSGRPGAGSELPSIPSKLENNFLLILKKNRDNLMRKIKALLGFLYICKFSVVFSLHFLRGVSTLTTKTKIWALKTRTKLVAIVNSLI